MKTAIVILALFALCPAARAESSMKALLLQAIDAPDGKASGWIEGEEVTRLQNALQTRGRVQAEVTTVARYKQAGCRRLAARFTIPGETFKSKDGKMLPFESGFRMNLCRTGLAPETTELEK